MKHIELILTDLRRMPLTSPAPNEISPTPPLSYRYERISRGFAMRCQAKNKSGQPCSAAVVRGTKQCVMHSGRATELGSKGGHRRTIYNPDNLKVFLPPQTAADLRDLLAQSIIEIRSGNLDPKLANSISYLGTGFMKALEVSDTERRLAVLEEKAGLTGQPAKGSVAK